MATIGCYKINAAQLFPKMFTLYSIGCNCPDTYATSGYMKVYRGWFLTQTKHELRSEVSLQGITNLQNVQVLFDNSSFPTIHCCAENFLFNVTLSISYLFITEILFYSNNYVFICNNLIHFI